MSKIVYLFGAGASCECLPMVRNMTDRIIQFISFLELVDNQLSPNEIFDTALDRTKAEYQESMIKDLKQLVESCKNHASIDTYAKKLFVKSRHGELKKLKIGLSAFLLFEQALQNTDSRYDAFYASLLKTSTTELPETIRILSWNYDFQFEIAYMEYSEDYRHWASAHTLNIASKHIRTNNRANAFGIYKLNGTVGLTDGLTRHFTFIDNFKLPVTIETVNQIVYFYTSGLFNSKLYPTISFAWEEDFYDVTTRKSIISQAIEATEDAEVLVIIGYSFPFFNREIDRKLIKSMRDLRKVYVQDINTGGVIQRFKAIRPDFNFPEIEPYKEVEQFLLPDEL